MASYTQKDVDVATQGLMERLRVKGGFKPLTPESSAFRVKSVQLTSDKRLREMEHFLRSHTYMERIMERGQQQCNTFLTADADDGYESEPHVCDPRGAGVDKLNQELKKLSEKSMSSPRMAGASILSAAGQSSTESPRKTVADAALDSRKRWREGLDKNLRLMLEDLNLSRNDTLDNGGHKMVCGQFEKTYDWFSTCGGKSAKKERQIDPYLKFDPGKDPMPGSTRGLPKREQT
eukprot:TRINITY_DN77813_c0_g1_i1.p1 TRINITY_DN77813_c0_g1~~TRINITY_DN77813_c0_g1_i1.p1  ORF type:complete len:234 (+),score=36.81 TRINITY_DN77813_c0_g1_i1:58-759(+)